MSQHDVSAPAEPRSESLLPNGGSSGIGERGSDDAAVSVEVQLHAGDLGEVDRAEDGRAAARSYIESVGGNPHGFWYAFGTHDGYTLWEAPDNVSVAAVALAIGAGGALSSLETTALLTVEETMDAVRKAQHFSTDRLARHGRAQDAALPVPFTLTDAQFGSGL